MSLITVHLRWNDVGPEQYEQIRRAAPERGQLPPGCLSRQVRRQGCAVLATEVWDSTEAVTGMDHLTEAVRDAGVEEPPQTAMFAVPGIFAAGYRRPARRVDIPLQPGAPAGERETAPAPAPQ